MFARARVCACMLLCSIFMLRMQFCTVNNSYVCIHVYYFMITSSGDHKFTPVEPDWSYEVLQQRSLILNNPT